MFWINSIKVFHFNQGKEYSVLAKIVHNFGIYIVAFYAFSSFRYIVGNQGKLYLEYESLLGVSDDNWFPIHPWLRIHVRQGWCYKCTTN